MDLSGEEMSGELRGMGRGKLPGRGGMRESHPQLTHEQILEPRQVIASKAKTKFENP